MLALKLQQATWAAACLACALAGIQLGQARARAAEASLAVDASALAAAALAHAARTGRPTPSCAEGALAPCVGDAAWPRDRQAAFWIEADDETTGFTVYGVRRRDGRQVFHRVAGHYPAR